jgi:hypothetical protein
MSARSDTHKKRGTLLASTFWRGRLAGMKAKMQFWKQGVPTAVRPRKNDDNKASF